MAASRTTAGSSTVSYTESAVSSRTYNSYRGWVEPNPYTGQWDDANPGSSRASSTCLQSTASTAVSEYMAWLTTDVDLEKKVPGAYPETIYPEDSASVFSRDWAPSTFSSPGYVREPPRSCAAAAAAAAYAAGEQRKKASGMMRSDARKVGAGVARGGGVSRESKWQGGHLSRATLREEPPQKPKSRSKLRKLFG